MAENIYDILRSEYSEALIKQLNANEDVSTFLQLVYNHLLKTASERRGNPKSIVCTVDVVKERLLRVVVRYEGQDDQAENLDMSYNPVQRNLSLVTFLRVNVNVKGLALRVVDTLEKWIAEKPYRKEVGYTGIRLVNSVYWKNLIFTSEIVLKPEFDYGVMHKMGWDKEPEQPVERIVIP